MSIKKIKELDNARKTAQAHWESVKEQIADTVENEKQAALIEILALREMALVYKKAATNTNLSPLSSKRSKKSFVR